MESLCRQNISHSMLWRFKERIGFPQLWNQFVLSCWPTASLCHTVPQCTHTHMQYMAFRSTSPLCIYCIEPRAICYHECLWSTVRQWALRDTPLALHWFECRKENGALNPSWEALESEASWWAQFHHMLMKMNRACIERVGKCRTPHFQSPLQFLWVESKSFQWAALSPCSL